MRKSVGNEALIGRTIAGKFVVEDLIGSGAMGAVFRARQIALEKTVAIKVLHGENADDATFAARFHREAKAASRLNHPNSMQVIDFGQEPDGLLYIAMEYLDGRSLHKLLREDWPLAPSRIADILMQTLAALAVAHDESVVHRDLKPENVMVLRGTDDDGRPKDIVKVCDFGIAKITDSRAYRSGGEATGDRESNAPVTTAGFLVGTPEYMSPEQGRGEKLDTRSDLYSVGVILFQMLTGRVPFEAENAIGVVLKHITEEPPRPSAVARGIDPRLEAICMRALRKPRDARYQTAREMRAELRAVAEGRDVPPQGQYTTSVRVHTDQPASVNAATVQMISDAHIAAAAEESAPKATLQGTTAAIPGLPRRRRLAVVVAAVTALVAGVGSVAIYVKATRTSVAPPADSRTLAAAGTSEPSATSPDSVATLAPIDPTSHPQPWHSGMHGKPLPSAAPSSKTAPSASAAPSAVASTTPTPSATATATATTTATATATTPEVDPSFDPDRAYVEVGLVNAQGVRDSAVRGALRGVGLSQCYKTALKARGSRATGVATLSLSIDEKGATRSAIVTGADFLPGLARCIQGSAAGVRVAQSQVDSGGGTADVTLAFRAP